MNSAPVYVYDAVRTPRGKARADGALAALAPQELVRQLYTALNGRLDRAAEYAETLVLGCVGQIGAQGGNIALISKLHAGLSDELSAYTLNNYCVSSLSAIGQAAQMVGGGQVQRALAGGVEMMSLVPFMADKADYYTDASFPPRSRYVPVALAADRLAESENIDRASMDKLAYQSHQRAALADASRWLTRSRVSIKTKNGSVALAKDECVRPQTTLEELAALTPAFGDLAIAYAQALDGRKIDHRHTIAHAPPICDGASLALITADRDVQTRPRAHILSYAEIGGDPGASLLAGFDAMDRALARARMSLDDIDCVEFMEAFAVTIAKFLRDHDVDPARVNVSGGHLAKGHPMGASGGILLSTLLDVLEGRDATTGLIVASGASGVGAAMVIERIQ